uniref:Uncharacterized protein n=1 Tax=Anguilla anguilla TaxID=7936 RepID=A0A0E9UPQ5_ANGAN
MRASMPRGSSSGVRKLPAIHKHGKDDKRREI